jgi:hypothetical protein
MELLKIKQPLTNVQLELLKIFSHQLSDNELVDLKKILVSFFSKRLIKEADRVWEEKGWDEQEVEKILNSKIRKLK